MASTERVGLVISKKEEKGGDTGDLKEVPLLQIQNETPSASKLQKEKKIGHRRVDESGQTTYKKTPSTALSGSIQRGISHTVAGLSSKPERDILLQDFQVVETISFPSIGSNFTPAHHFGDFTFRTYAPIAFRYFRDLFGIQPDDYMLSISKPLTELSNPGASGSLFFVTHDDEYIIKTVQYKEAEFLQKLLPGYYMNLVQNPRTLLPKFYGLYCVKSGGRNIRIVVMNNLLPSHLQFHRKYDLKGSTYKRKISKHEKEKKCPTFKDLDITSEDPDGFLLDEEIYNVLLKTLQRDCLVLQSFKIMDYSLLLAVHNIDRRKAEKSGKNKAGVEGRRRSSVLRKNFKERSRRSRTDSIADGKAHFVARSGIISSTLLRQRYSKDLELWSGGIPATNTKGERLLLFCGIIDILQCYKLKKKLEHTFKSLFADGDTISVHRPAFYCERFQKFMIDNVFRKNATAVAQLEPNRISRRPHSICTLLPIIPSSSDLTRLQSLPDLLPTDSSKSIQADCEPSELSILPGTSSLSSLSPDGEKKTETLLSRKTTKANRPKRDSSKKRQRPLRRRIEDTSSSDENLNDPVAFVRRKAHRTYESNV